MYQKSHSEDVSGWLFDVILRGLLKLKIYAKPVRVQAAPQACPNVLPS